MLIKRKKMTIEEHPFTSNRWYNHLQTPSLKEKWFIENLSNNQPTSFGYMPSKKLESIFLGTFPIWEITSGPIGKQNLEFFYGSIVNDFWNCLGSIFEQKIDTVFNRISILDNNNIGLTDILNTVNRNPSNSSSDNDLEAIKYNNILNLKKSFPQLKNIFITSGGKGPIGNLNNKNKNVATWLKDSLKNQEVSGFNTAGFVKKIKVNDESFNLIYLFSPSNSANTAIKGILNKNENFGINNLTIQEFRKIQWCYFIKKYHLGQKTNETIDKYYNLVLNNNKLLDFFNI